MQTYIQASTVQSYVGQIRLIAQQAKYAAGEDKMRRSIRSRAAALGALVITLGAGPAIAAEAVAINIASTFPGNMPILGDAAKRLTEKVSRASGGKIIFRFHEPGEIVRPAETVNAVANGTVPAAWAGAGWFAGKDSAFNMFSTVPFGPGIGEYLAWLYYGGGLEMAREMFHANNVHNIPCIIIPPEASGWFQKEIKSVEDLKNLKMRFFGLGAKVMQKLGVVTNQLPPGEILEAMKSGMIDATEFSLPAMDKPLGFHTVANTTTSLAGTSKRHSSISTSTRPNGILFRSDTRPSLNWPAATRCARRSHKAKPRSGRR